MIDFLYLIPVALALGAIGLGAFMWSLGSGQYEDLDGAAERILFAEEDAPERPAHRYQVMTQLGHHESNVRERRHRGGA